MGKYKRDMILKWHADGYSVDETARLLQVSEREVVDVIRAATPKEVKAAERSPDFVEPPLFDE